MMDKGHCFMNTENFEEYAKYYDFSEQIREFAQLHQNNNKNYEEAEIEIDQASEEEEDSNWEDNDEGIEEEEGEKDEEDQAEEMKNEFRDGMIKEKRNKTILRFKKAKLLDNGEI